MAVYKRSYRAYTGPLTPVRWRWLAITRYSLADMFASRVTTLLFVICMLPPLVMALVIYMLNSDTARALMNLRQTPMFINNRFFLTVFGVQGWLALFLTAWIAPASVSPDLTNGALPLYLSRPISRAEYLGGKLLGFAVTLSAVTWVPMLLLFGIQAETAQGNWARPNLFIAWGMVLGALIWIAVLGLVALAVSAWVKWRIVSTGVLIAIILVPAGVGAVVSAIMRTKWGLILNVPYVTTVIWAHLLRVPLSFDHIPVSAAWIALLAVCGLALLLLNVRVRARQVVRG